MSSSGFPAGKVGAASGERALLEAGYRAFSQDHEIDNLQSDLDAAVTPGSP